MAHDVFISHSSKDKLVADAICASLEGNGIRCWIAPRDVMPGLEWGDAIVTAIARSRCMVVVMSSCSNDSKQVLREVERGISKDLVIVPFRIEDVAPSGALEYFLSAPHWLDALTPPLEQHLTRLVTTVSLLLGSRGGAEPEPSVRASTREPRESGRDIPKEDTARVVVFNASSSVTHFLSGTIDVEVDGRDLGRLRRKEYLETALTPGSHRLSLRHLDGKHWESTQDILIQGDAAYLKVYATTTSTAVETVSGLPTFFQRKFRRADASQKP